MSRRAGGPGASVCGPEVRFLGDLTAGAFSVEPVVAGDWLRIAEIAARYRDLPLGTVDASVVATAERLGVEEIATGRPPPLQRRAAEPTRPPARCCHDRRVAASTSHVIAVRQTSRDLDPLQAMGYNITSPADAAAG